MRSRHALVCALVVGCSTPGHRDVTARQDAPPPPQSPTPAAVAVNPVDTFALVDIGGRPLPTTIMSLPMTQCRQDMSVSADRLIFTKSAFYERTRISWRGCPDSAAAPRDTMNRGGSYKLAGDSLVLTFGDGSEVEQELSGTMHGDTIIVFGETPDRAFHFVRTRRP